MPTEVQFVRPGQPDAPPRHPSNSSYNFTFIIVVLFVFLRGLRRVRQNQRAVSFRLGRMKSYLEPGVHWIPPLLGSIVKVNLPQHVPGWEELPEIKVHDQVLDVVRMKRAVGDVPMGGRPGGLGLK